MTDFMKKGTIVLLLGALLAAGVSGCAFWTRITTGEIPRMEPAELEARLDDPNLVIVDFRRSSGWNASQLKIKGAVRESDDVVLNWPYRYFPKIPKDKTIVLYCA